MWSDSADFPKGGNDDLVDTKVRRRGSIFDKMWARYRATARGPFLSYGTSAGLYFFGQYPCRRCGAWLREHPTRSHSIPTTKKQGRKGCPQYHGSGRAARAADQLPTRCACVHEVATIEYRYAWTCLRCQRERTASTSWSPALVRPGPWKVVNLPGSFPAQETWWLDRRLVDTVLRTTHDVVPDAGRVAIAGKESLLDHEGCRVVAWGTYRGDVSDATGIRRALAILRHGAHGAEGQALCALVERAVLTTAVVHGEVHAGGYGGATDPMGSEARAHLLPVTPVIGAGRLSLTRRFDRWIEQHDLAESVFDRGPGNKRLTGPLTFVNRIRLGDEVLLAFNLYGTGDSSLDTDRDVIRIRGLLGGWRETVRPRRES